MTTPGTLLLSLLLRNTARSSLTNPLDTNPMKSNSVMMESTMSTPSPMWPPSLYDLRRTIVLLTCLSSQWTAFLSSRSSISLSLTTEICVSSTISRQASPPSWLLSSLSVLPSKSNSPSLLWLLLTVASLLPYKCLSRSIFSLNSLISLIIGAWTSLLISVEGKSCSRLSTTLSSKIPPFVRRRLTLEE